MKKIFLTVPLLILFSALPVSGQQVITGEGYDSYHPEFKTTFYLRSPKIVQYKIVTVFSDKLGEDISSLLEGRIKILIEQGWVPLGAPFTDGHRSWCQAMVKYEPAK